MKPGVGLDGLENLLHFSSQLLEINDILEMLETRNGEHIFLIELCDCVILEQIQRFILRVGYLCCGDCVVYQGL